MTIVGFGGRIASGKSAISKAVAARLGVPRASFGDAVRAEAEKRGLAESRLVLQNLGEELIAAGWDGFCELVVAQAVWDGRKGLLLIDGIRHPDVMGVLCRIAAPYPALTVFIETPSERRRMWLAARGVSEQEALAADAHPNEAGVAAVRRGADLVVQNDGSIDEAVDEIVNALIGFDVLSRP